MVLRSFPFTRGEAEVQRGEEACPASPGKSLTRPRVLTHVSLIRPSRGIGKAADME